MSAFSESADENVLRLLQGEYPIGAVAAVKAANKSAAAELLNAELNARGLPQRSPLTEDAFVELPRGEGVTILLDGNY